MAGPQDSVATVWGHSHAFECGWGISDEALQGFGDMLWLWRRYAVTEYQTFRELAPNATCTLSCMSQLTSQM